MKSLCLIQMAMLILCGPLLSQNNNSSRLVSCEVEEFGDINTWHNDVTATQVNVVALRNTERYDYDEDDDVTVMNRAIIKFAIPEFSSFKVKSIIKAEIKIKNPNNNVTDISGGFLIDKVIRDWDWNDISTSGLETSGTHKVSVSPGSVYYGDHIFDVTSLLQSMLESGQIKDYGFLIKSNWNVTFAIQKAGCELRMELEVSDVDAANGVAEALYINHDPHVSNKFQLLVNGNTFCEGVKVIDVVGLWPDYVFEDDYSIPALSQLEQYIKLNSRLPDFPSAEQVMKSGVDLVELQSKVLKQIEVLTLHAIEMGTQLDKEN